LTYSAVSVLTTPGAMPGAYYGTAHAGFLPGGGIQTFTGTVEDPPGVTRWFLRLVFDGNLSDIAPHELDIRTNEQYYIPGGNFVTERIVDTDTPGNVVTPRVTASLNPPPASARQA
jgi:hypothetical protein